MSNVLVPLATVNLRKDSKVPVHFARATYIEKIVRHGLTPIFISPLMPREMIDELYAQCQGVLFMGGGDFDAAHYGQANHPLNDRAEPERDKLELYLLGKALKDKKPFLGICRGCQALAIASGGTLCQHLHDLKLPEKHGISESAGYDVLVNQNAHRISITKGSRMNKVTGRLAMTVNSGHHQAVETVGWDLVISARSAHGVIEAIEHRDKKYFCLGVQYHPEASDEPAMDKIFSAFVRAIEKA